MFIDLKNGTCINADEVLGASFGKVSGSYVINITLKPNKHNQHNQHNTVLAPKANSIDVKFDEGIQANAYIKKYFNIDHYFD
ncbi:hypothetical protein ACH8I4_15265 [Acinetobacter sp. ABJ_C3_5]|uniref:hypothetical protein n=1 Tax=Acinetobacter courvalinii TaxID=280147 RepID=UPI0037CA4867